MPLLRHFSRTNKPKVHFYGGYSHQLILVFHSKKRCDPSRKIDSGHPMLGGGGGKSLLPINEELPFELVFRENSDFFLITNSCETKDWNHSGTSYSFFAKLHFVDELVEHCDRFFFALTILDHQRFDWNPLLSFQF